jgi:4-alpha-glucanotransferase
MYCLCLAVLCRYEEDEERRERFYYTMLGGGGAPPVSACPDVARLVVQQHFNCPSAWCILPLQVWG